MQREVLVVRGREADMAILLRWCMINKEGDAGRRQRGHQGGPSHLLALPRSLFGNYELQALLATSTLLAQHRLKSG